MKKWFVISIVWMVVAGSIYAGENVGGDWDASSLDKPITQKESVTSFCPPEASSKQDDLPLTKAPLNPHDESVVISTSKRRSPYLGKKNPNVRKKIPFLESRTQGRTKDCGDL